VADFGPPSARPGCPCTEVDPLLGQRGVDADLAKYGVALQPAHRRHGLEIDLVRRVAWA
jgi:hypothetical protein